MKNLQKKEAFTLIELAIVLMVIGLLVGLGTSLIGPLTKQTKVVESREVVKNARAALLGYAVKNGYLPLSTNPDPLGLAGARKMDAWGNNLIYYVATSLDGAGNACGTTTTNIVVRECTSDDCTSYNTKSNIAFIVYSTGGDADNVCTGTSTPFRIWLQGSGYNSPCTYTATNPAYQYDDLVQYATLDEIRSAMGCSSTTTTTPPNPPTAVLATRATLSSINLTWTEPALATPDSALAGYEIDRSIAGGAYSLFQSIGLGTIFTDTGLTAGQRYGYRMRTVDKAGNKSADSSASSTTVSPIRQTVAAVWSSPADGLLTCATTSDVENCGTAANRRKALFTIRNTGNAADNGANITVTSMIITWGATVGTVKKILAPDATTSRYCNTTGTAPGSPITLTTPLTINAGASSTIGIYFCTSGAQPTFVSPIQFNNIDGSFSLY